MATKNITLKKQIGDTMYDLMVKTIAEQVSGTYNSSPMTLDQIITAIETELGNKASGTEFTELKNTVTSFMAGEGISDSYDTLLEISNWITSHEELYQTLVTLAQGKVDKEDGKGLSTEDFTTELKTKLEGIPSDLTTQLSTITGNVSQLQTDLDAAEGNITTLQSSMSSVEGNIDTIEGNVSTLQQTVTNIQQTVSSTGKVILSATQPEELTENDLWLEDTSSVEGP